MVVKMKSLLKPGLWESISYVLKLSHWILLNLKNPVAVTGFFSISIYETQLKVAEMTKIFP